jgi:hypothetical protein
MTRSIYKRIATALVPGALAIAIGCNSSTTPAGADKPSEGGDHPAINVVLRWERVTQGKNFARDEYASRIDNCKAAGWQVLELSADEIGKLDTGIVELWVDARGAYGRETRWALGVMNTQSALEDKGVCMAKLEEAVTEGDADFSDRAASTDTIDPAEQDAQARVLGYERIGMSQVSGQPCMRWRGKEQEVCEWSAGQAWGFEDGPAPTGCATQGPMDYLNPIPLEAKPAERASGCIVQLRSMTVSKGQLPEVGRALGARRSGA